MVNWERQKSSKEYQGIQEVLVTTNLLKSTTKIFAQSNFNTHTDVFKNSIHMTINDKKNTNLKNI